MKPTTRTWKRTLVVLLLFIVAGTIINFAVGWGCFVWRPGQVKREELSVGASTLIWDRFGAPLNNPRKPGVERIEYGPCFYEAHAKDFSGAASFEIVELGAGWPEKSLLGQIWEDIDAHWLLNAPRMRLLQAEDLNNNPSWMNALPCYPIWPGFAINTIFYTGILWLLFTAPGFVRRRSRIKRNLCPACAYPVGSSEVCTECGTFVMSRQSSA